MFTFLTVFIVIAAILLIIVVLLQNGKGQGMASKLLTSANQTLGVRQTADILSLEGFLGSCHFHSRCFHHYGVHDQNHRFRC